MARKKNSVMKITPIAPKIKEIKKIESKKETLEDEVEETEEEHFKKTVNSFSGRALNTALINVGNEVTEDQLAGQIRNNPRDLNNNEDNSFRYNSSSYTSNNKNYDSAEQAKTISTGGLSSTPEIARGRRDEMSERRIGMNGETGAETRGYNVAIDSEEERQKRENRRRRF